MGPIFSSPHFVVAVRKGAARHAEAHVGIWTECMRQSQLGIKINRRDSHAQREVVAIEIRAIQIIEGVSRDGGMTFERRVVAQMKKLALVGIDLRRSRDARESS